MMAFSYLVQNWILIPQLIYLRYPWAMTKLMIGSLLNNYVNSSQWDLVLFKTEPAHISIKSGFNPKFIRQPAILNPTICEVALKMLQGLEKRGFIKKCISDWSSHLIVLRKSPREYKIGSVKTSSSICKVPGLKIT